jgi:hypothetical protein
LALVALTSWAVPARAIDLHLESTGVRGAFSNPFEHARFYHTEAYVKWNLPWRWDLGREWHLQARLELTGGWMNGRGEDAVFGTIGPGFVAGWKEFPLVLEAGTSPTALGREQFGNTDFGTIFQFTTHAGLTWHATSHLEVGWRFEHMSNANIGPSNPGVNLYSFGAGWRF